MAYGQFLARNCDFILKELEICLENTRWALVPLHSHNQHRANAIHALDPHRRIPVWHSRLSGAQVIFPLTQTFSFDIETRHALVTGRFFVWINSQLKAVNTTAHRLQLLLALSVALESDSRGAIEPFMAVRTCWTL